MRCDRIRQMCQPNKLALLAAVTKIFINQVGERMKLFRSLVIAGVAAADCLNYFVFAVLGEMNLTTADFLVFFLSYFQQLGEESPGSDTGGCAEAPAVHSKPVSDYRAITSSDNTVSDSETIYS